MPLNDSYDSTKHHYDSFHIGKIIKNYWDLFENVAS